MFLFISINITAQQIFPIKTDHRLVPANSYLKDLNNELDFYVGTWKANYDGKQVYLFVTKEINKLFYYKPNNVYKDALIVTYEIRTGDGQLILYSNSNATISQFGYKDTIQSFYPDNNGNEVFLYYAGNNCRVGWGSIYFNKINATQFSWKYRPNSTLLTDDSCPGNQDTTIYLPVTDNLVFTKQ